MVKSDQYCPTWIISNKRKINVLSNEEYHDSRCISHSKEELIMERPSRRMIMGVLAGKIKRPVSDAMLLGAAVHEFVLEGPEVFNKNFIITPSDAPRKPLKLRSEYTGKITEKTLTALDYWEKFYSKSYGKTILSVSEGEMLHRCRNSVFRNKIAKNFLRDEQLQVEVSFRMDVLMPVSREKITFQCRADSYLEHGDGTFSIYDLKTIDSLQTNIRNWWELRNLDDNHWCLRQTDSIWRRKLLDRGYARQQAFYKWIIEEVTGLKMRHFRFILVEKPPPSECCVVQFDDGDCAEADRQIEEYRNVIDWCLSGQKMGISQDKVYIL